MTAASHVVSSDPSSDARVAGRTTRILCLSVAAIVLFDLVSQYVLTVLPARPGEVVWRATAAQILTTQVSPLVLVAVLAVIGGRMGTLDTRRWGRAVMAVGLLLGVATAVVLIDAPAALEHVDLRAPEAFRRASVRALVSGTLGAVVMLWAGWVLLRQPQGVGTDG